MDFKCTGDNLELISENVIKETGITFPAAHTDRNSMATLARALRKSRGDVIARVPFCLTVEAEAMGGQIKLGNNAIGPRVEDYAYASVAEMASYLKDLETNHGRIREVLDSVKILAQAGEKVALTVEGPLTIISSLVDPMNFYKGLRKDPQAIGEILSIVEAGIIRYALEGINQGAAVISYGDPVGAMDIVGPKVYRDFSGPASLRIINRLLATEEKVLVHLCGKTSTALEKVNLARSFPMESGDAVTYGQALVGLLDRVTGPVAVGHRCIKWSAKKLKEPVLWGIELARDSETPIENYPTIS